MGVVIFLQMEVKIVKRESKVEERCVLEQRYGRVKFAADECRMKIAAKEKEKKLKIEESSKQICAAYNRDIRELIQKRGRLTEEANHLWEQMRKLQCERGYAFYSPVKVESILEKDAGVVPKEEEEGAWKQRRDGEGKEYGGSKQMIEGGRRNKEPSEENRDSEAEKKEEQESKGVGEIEKIARERVSKMLTYDRQGSAVQEKHQNSDGDEYTAEEMMAYLEASEEDNGAGLDSDVHEWECEEVPSKREKEGGRAGLAKNSKRRNYMSVIGERSVDMAGGAGKRSVDMGEVPGVIVSVAGVISKERKNGNAAGDDDDDEDDENDDDNDEELVRALEEAESNIDGGVDKNEMKQGEAADMKNSTCHKGLVDRCVGETSEKRTEKAEKCAAVGEEGGGEQMSGEVQGKRCNDSGKGKTTGSDMQLVHRCVGERSGQRRKKAEKCAAVGEEGGGEQLSGEVQGRKCSDSGKGKSTGSRKKCAVADEVVEVDFCHGETSRKRRKKAEKCAGVGGEDGREHISSEEQAKKCNDAAKGKSSGGHEICADTDKVGKVQRGRKKKHATVGGESSQKQKICRKKQHDMVGNAENAEDEGSEARGREVVTRGGQIGRGKKNEGQNMLGGVARMSKRAKTQSKKMQIYDVE